jgi:predicted nucleic acid-binding protein
VADLCFVDSNVLLYRRDNRDAAKQRQATAWIETLWISGSGRISWQVVVEFAANVRRIDPGHPYERARREILRFVQWEPVPTSRALIERAWTIEDRYHISWWDALIVAAAQAAGCAYLLSEDLQDGQRFDSVTIVDPFAHDVASVLG